MRKMLDKKGFSLVELMIVVVIMGILIAVAIPLYGTITTNAKNKTCASNIDAIQNSAVVYYTEHGAKATQLSDLTFEGSVPECPWGAEMDNYTGYNVTFNADGTATVVCGAQSVEGSHAAD